MSRALSVVVAVALLAAPAVAQRPDPRKMGVVFTLAGTESVRVRANLPYKGELTMDLYSPPSAPAGARLPAVVFVNGIGAPELKDWKVYQDWGRLVAASGMVGINYQSRQDPAADAADLVRHLRENAASLGVDENRICIWSCSANVGVGLPFVLDPSRTYIRCAVFYYGAMNQKATRDDVPMLVARAGLDGPQLNRGIDEFVKDAIAREVPLTLVNYAEGQHAFDIFDDTATSREYVRQTLDFMKFHLTKEVDPRERDARALIPAAFSAFVAEKGWPAARERYEALRARYPFAHLYREDGLNAVGYSLLQSGRTKEALEVLTYNAAAFPESANVYDSLADAYEAAGEKALAIENAERALEKLAASTQGPPAMRDAIRASAEAKLKRLRPER
jgi:dienelactone hydrolase